MTEQKEGRGDMESRRISDESMGWENVKKMLRNGRIGLWKLWTDETGQKHLECDATMCELMGVQEGIDPVEAERFLGERIEEEDRERFAEYDRRLREEGRAEILYRWYHPQRGRIYIRCCGWAEQEEERQVICGFHQDVTPLRQLNQDEFSQLEPSSEHEQKKKEYLGAQASLNRQYTMIQALTKQRHQLSEENKQLQENQRKVSAELETVMRGINGGYAINEASEGYPYQYVSEELAQMQGYRDVGEFLKANHNSGLRNIWEADREWVKVNLSRQLDQSDIYSLKYRVICKDGTPKWVMDSGRYTVENGRKILRSILLDIDRHEKINQMYKDERRRYREALLHDCEYAVTLNLSKGLVEDGYLVRQNVRIKLFKREDYPVSLNKYLDAVRDEIQVLGQEPLVLGDGSLRRQLIEEYHAGCRNKEFEYYDHIQDIYVRITVLMSENENGDVNAIVVGRDITEQKRAQEEARKTLEKACLEAELANAAKSDFLARMSHDVRTPLNGILGLLEIAARCAGDRDKVEECMDKAVAAARHLLSLLSDVLDMSKLESGAICLAEETFDMRELLKETYEIMEGPMRERGITGTNRMQKPLQHPYVIGSPSHVRQIITNLLSNAVKYNKEGGSIDATASEAYGEDGTVRFTYTISDTGIGMSPEYLKHIFEPFSREKDGAESSVIGTGLGMSIVKKLVDKMQGTIEVESEKGVGTTFRVMLPFRCAKKPDERLARGNLSGRDLKGVRLLLVEDNELNRDVAKYLLGDEGAEVDTACNGEEAVQAFQNRKEGYYDVILMDMMMPVLDGCGAAQQIRALARPDAASIPILALTANAFSDDIRRCREAGMNAHIAKPMQIRQAVKLIRQFVPQKELKEREKEPGDA